jgi:site-specific recombinase XerD
MSDTVISSELVRPREEVFTDPEALALAGFLSGYSGLTRDAYALDLRQFAIWCRDLELHLFASKRVHIEAFARDLEAKGRSRATIARRLCTVTCFYRYAEQEGLIDHSPAVHVRRPRLDYESHAVGLDRNELGAMLVAAGLAGARDHALIALLAMNGLRVSEAAGANIEQLGMERGHRTLTVLRKGGKTVTMPMSPRTARAVDLAVGERFEGPILLGNDGERLDRHAAARIVRRIGKAAGINKKIGPHTLRHGFITAALDAGVPLRDVQEAASHAEGHHDALRPGPCVIGPARDLHRVHLHRRCRPLNEGGCRCQRRGTGTRLDLKNPSRSLARGRTYRAIGASDLYGCLFELADEDRLVESLSAKVGFTDPVVQGAHLEGADGFVAVVGVLQEQLPLVGEFGGYVTDVDAACVAFAHGLHRSLSQ